MKICPACGLQYPDDQSKCFVDNVPLQSAPDPHLGQVLAGRYLIEAPIGEGGMATVYRARHTLVDRPVAVKIMGAVLARDASLRERFRREAKNAASLAHPNIIEIYDYGETENDSIFMVMELLEGAPLAEHILHGPMSPGRVAALGLQIARGLARAHDFDVIHRDLKPENIFVCRLNAETEQIKLLDFGIARSMHDSRLTNAGEIFGTPQYMAPERVTSIDAGPSADLYALGVILFEMLTGKLPFQAEELTGFFIKHIQETPPRPSDLAPQCPRRLEELILKLLAKKPEERPVDAHQIIKELRALSSQARDSIAPPMGMTPSRPLTAPTLPPTTLDRWVRRTAIFEEMMQKAFPHRPPPGLRELLEEIRSTLQDIRAIRGDGLKEQRVLEELEQEARDNRARLGFAVQNLAEDLSQAREAARCADLEVAPYLQAEEQAEQTYEQAQAKLVGLGGYRRIRKPDQTFALQLREIADSLDRWALSFEAAEKARRWRDAKHHAAKDLEFQVKALRDQLDRLESRGLEKKQSSEQVLIAGGKKAEERERVLTKLASSFCEQLRARKELRTLFHRLEQEG